MTHDEQNAEHLEAEVRRLQHAVELLRERIRMLEDENHALVSKLRELGVAAHESTSPALELPPPNLTPLVVASNQPPLSAEDLKLLQELCPGEAIFVLERCDSGVDVGNWLGDQPIWLAASDHDVTLLAAGRKPYFEKIPYSQLYRSLYNPVTGELVLAPAPELRQTHLSIGRTAAERLLAQIFHRQ